MNYKDHLAVAACPLVAVTAFYLSFWEGVSWPDSLMVGGLAVAVGLYGALLPDFDIRNSRAYALTMGGAALLAIYAILAAGQNERLVAILLALFVLASLLPHHRKAFHHPGASLIYGGVLFLAFRSPLASLAGVVGYLSHIVADGGHR